MPLPPRLLLAGVASGVGKTTVTVALARALRARGLRVATYKCGPDYLDPSYHARASGAPCHNLDGWLMGREAVLATIERTALGADLVLIEGVMGLFDGAAPDSEEGSAAEIAKWVAAPVVLVADASGMARSIAALAQGFAGFDPALRLAGLICNRVGSRRHLELLRAASPTIPILGGLPKDERLHFPERHLGLHTADEASAPEDRLEACGTLAQDWLDIDALLAVARERLVLPAGGPPQPPALKSAAAPVSIGVARDEAFHFYYDANLRLLEEAGAVLHFFSPLHDASLPPVNGLYIGGGYPELHAAALAANQTMLEALRAFAQSRRPIYAECGGLMYLAEAIRLADGAEYPMAALLPGVAAMQPRLRALGYAEVETLSPTPLGPAGLRLRGHQFRYSELQLAAPPGELQFAYRVSSRRQAAPALEGYACGSVLGSYVHLHWARTPEVAANFVAACAGSS